MKHLFHIATGQFEFIEEEYEGTAEEAVEAYKSLTEAFRASIGAGAGLTPKDFNRAVDEFNLTGSLKDGPDLYANMSTNQQFYFQTQKKSLKRLESKHPVEDMNADKVEIN